MWRLIFHDTFAVLYKRDGVVATDRLTVVFASDNARDTA